MRRQTAFGIMGAVLGLLVVAVLSTPVVSQEIARLYATYSGQPIALQATSAGALKVNLNGGGGDGGIHDTVFKVQPLDAPTTPTATCDPGGTSGVEVDRFFQVVAVDAYAGQSLPSTEVSVSACDDDSTITVTWDAVLGASTYTVYWADATGAKASRVDLDYDPARITQTFTILTGAGGVNLVDDATTSVTLPTVNTAYGAFYRWDDGSLWASQVYATDLYVQRNIEIDGAAKFNGQTYNNLQAHAAAGATETLDWNLGNVHRVILDENVTLTFANPIDGSRYIVYFVQDVTGTNTVTWPAAAVLWPAATAPTITATGGAITVCALLYDGTLTKYIGMCNLDIR
jgi:hypothetical protein